MKKITLYSPGLSSYNLGDKIIHNSAKYQLKYILDNAFVTEIPTHLPHSWYYMRPLINNDFKFVLGSNLLKSTFFGFKRQWDVTILKSWITGPCILVGAGWWQYGNEPNFYTKVLLKLLLSNKYVHSVRDEYTKLQLSKIGITNVVNTSCSTMWSLTSEHCKDIKTTKSKDVVFTLTDYNKNESIDLNLIKVLEKNYEDVYFWPQGVGDYEYIKSLINNMGNTKVKILPATLEAFDQILASKNVDFIGTRLHGGIRALQFKIRTMILSVDNRALEKKKDFNLPVLDRADFKGIDKFINTEYLTRINIPEEEINKWKSQFENC